MRRAVHLLVATSFLFACAQASSTVDVRSPHVAAGEPCSWMLTWDDKMDGVVSPDPKSAMLSLIVTDDVVTGHFEGTVLGVERSDHFSGQLIHGDRATLLVLRQEDRDYACMYLLQARQGVLNVGTLDGVWQDTKGRSGDALLSWAFSPPPWLPMPLR